MTLASGNVGCCPLSCVFLQGVARSHDHQLVLPITGRPLEAAHRSSLERNEMQPVSFLATGLAKGPCVRWKQPKIRESVAEVSSRAA